MKPRPTFLILDDDVNNRFLERDAFEEAFPDCRVVECGTVNDALAATKSEHFDGIVTDHHLGQSDGAEFVQHIRSAGVSCPVVMVTGSSDPQVVARALQAGATRVFSGSDSDFIGFFRQALKPARDETGGARAQGAILRSGRASSAIAKILIIAGDDPLREALGIALIEQGHQVSYARDGTGGVALCASSAPQVVIVDINLPNQDALVVIGTLRRQYPALGVIAIAGGGRVSVREYLNLAKQFGASATLAKPFSNDELTLAVASALGS